MDLSMDSTTDSDEGDPIPHNEHSEEIQKDDESTVSNSETNYASFPRLPPTTPIPHPSYAILAASDSTVGISPSKEGEVSMELSPCVKQLAGDSPLTLQFCADTPKTNRPPRSKVVSALFTTTCDSPDGGDTRLAGAEIQPVEVFTAASPESPSAEFQAMMNAIDISANAEGKDEDFLRRQTKPSIRRCRSLEMRKHLIDMSNTPPNAYKRTVFKRPPDLDSKQQLYKFTKRFRQRVAGASETKSQSSTISEECIEEAPGCSGSDDSEHRVEQERIKTAVDVLQSPDLIADGSRHYCLPVIIGKHSDLKNISSDTVADLLSGKFAGLFDKLTIIDCRYPYEYEGGHIKGAVNIYTEEAMVEFLNQEVQEVTLTSHKHILVFHCEFSSQRGPKLLRHLRKCDRQLNMSQYPQLTFPEVYCLHGGYKDFFLQRPELCEPSAYIPMTDEKYASDLRHFRAKAKSWAAGEKFKSKRK